MSVVDYALCQSTSVYDKYLKSLYERVDPLLPNLIKRVVHTTAVITIDSARFTENMVQSIATWSVQTTRATQATAGKIVNGTKYYSNQTIRMTKLAYRKTDYAVRYTIRTTIYVKDKTVEFIYQSFGFAKKAGATVSSAAKYTGETAVAAKDITVKTAVAAKDISGKAVVIGKDVYKSAGEAAVYTKDVTVKSVKVAKDISTKAIEKGKPVVEYTGELASTAIDKTADIYNRITKAA